MENNTIINDFDSAINIINSLSDIFIVDVWIPSLQKSIQFKEIETKQQKQLLSVAMQNSIYNNLFLDSFYEILKSNLIETESFKISNLDDLFLYDKICIALSLRKQISNKMKVFFDENKKIHSNIDLNLILEKFKTFKTENTFDVDFSNEKIKIKVELSIPTLKTEIDYENDIVKIFKKSNEIKTDDDVKNIIADAFITETTKHINKVVISDKEIDFKPLTLKQKIQIVEKIPSVLMQKILNALSDWKTKMDDILTVKHEGYETVIKIDSLLFLN